MKFVRAQVQIFQLSCFWERILVQSLYVVAADVQEFEVWISLKKSWWKLFDWIATLGFNKGEVKSGGNRIDRTAQQKLLQGWEMWEVCYRDLSECISAERKHFQIFQSKERLLVQAPKLSTTQVQHSQARQIFEALRIQVDQGAVGKGKLWQLTA